jgi:diacylglycerol O-acyltransferase / wax synthase
MDLWRQDVGPYDAGRSSREPQERLARAGEPGYEGRRLVWDRMTPLDAAFVDLEDEDRHASLAIASVAVLEGPAPGQDEFVAAIAGKLPLVPRYRQKLRTVPWDLGRPVWVDDPGFDIDYHIRRTALPAPGDDDALCRLVARVMSQRLDRERPLWECWVVEGLAGGRWAVISKVHHGMADGISGTHLYDAFFDHAPQPSAPLDDDWDPVAEPSTLRLTAEALRDLTLSPVEQLRLLTRAAQSPALAARRLYQTGLGALTLAGALRPATDSSLAGPIGAPRHYSIGRASLTDVVRIGKAFHATVNDVVLAAITSGYRQMLVQNGEDPEPHAVRTLVPVSVRAPDDHGTCENRISMLLPFLPVDVTDPVERLRTVHHRLLMLKASKEAEAGEAFTTLAEHEPFPPVSWGLRLAMRLPQRSVVTVTTNVPGPRRPLYCLGRRMLEIFPYVPIALRLRTGVSILSYCDQITFGVTSDFASDFATASDPGVLASAITAGIDELANAVPAGRRARKRSKALDESG